MSQEPINRSQDLIRLRNNGFDIRISEGYLLLRDVPYVNAEKLLKKGILASKLDLAGQITVRPSTHVALWVGEHPCDANGKKLTHIVNSDQHEALGSGLVSNHSFSQKPQVGYYSDYYEKMTTYVSMLENHAHVIDPNITAKTFPIIKPEEGKSVFCYIDTASSRAGTVAVNNKLKKGNIAIIGLGGTGSYLFDLVAKTIVSEIHVFDGDIFHQHNAFRCPGAPSVEELETKKTKVQYFTELYSKMRQGIIPHPYNLDTDNLSELNEIDFVFICIDNGEIKEEIVKHLLEKEIPFIDVGIGLELISDELIGLVRVTTATSTYNEHVPRRIPYNTQTENVYTNNIQIADINSLNASLAVIKWKKLWGFYADLPKEHHTVYSIYTNTITNEEALDEAEED